MTASVAPARDVTPAIEDITQRSDTAQPEVAVELVVCHNLSRVASEASTVSPADSVIEEEEEENEVDLEPLLPRRVHFNHDADTVHEITPYAEIYGIHPRLFDFDKGFWMVPSKGFQPPTPGMMWQEAEEDAESSSDEEEGGWFADAEPLSG